MKIQKHLEQLKREVIVVRVFIVPREENYKADMIMKLVMSITTEMPKNVLVEIAKVPCTEKMIVAFLEERKDQQIPILQYLRDDTLPSNPKEAKKVIRQFSRYAIGADDELYKRSFL